MKAVTVLLFSMILVMGCKDPPPKHDPEIIRECAVLPDIHAEYMKYENPGAITSHTLNN